MLLDKHSTEIRVILDRYPPGRTRSALMPLLYLAQREYGHLTPPAIREVADLAGVTPTEVGSLAGFYSLFRDHPSGRYQVQVCTDLPCALLGAEDLARGLCENLAVRLGQPTPDGMFMVEEVTCLAGCNKAPVIQIQGREGILYHEGQTLASVGQLLADLRRKTQAGR